MEKKIPKSGKSDSIRIKMRITKKRVENPKTGKTQAVEDKIVETEVPTRKRKSNPRKNITAFRGKKRVRTNV